jgi:S-adenosylmethionine synthetase
MMQDKGYCKVDRLAAYLARWVVKFLDISGIWGAHGDAGITGRKIILDTNGDCEICKSMIQDKGYSKVDRLASLAAL